MITGIFYLLRFIFFVELKYIYYSTPNTFDIRYFSSCEIICYKNAQISPSIGLFLLDINVLCFLSLMFLLVYYA